MQLTYRFKTATSKYVINKLYQKLFGDCRHTLKVENLDNTVCSKIKFDFTIIFSTFEVSHGAGPQVCGWC